MAKVTISMVTYNAIGYLPFVLPSLTALLEEDVELMILDNASKDDSVPYIRSHVPDVKVIVSNQNIGFGGGHNEVIHQSTADYVMIFNQDIIVEPDYLRQCISFLEKHPQVGAVTGILQRTQWADDGTPKMTEDIDTCGIRIKKSHNTKDMKVAQSWDEPFEIFGPSAACGVYRRSALEDVVFLDNGRKEYFDEDFFMYKEDVDLAYRLRWRGWSSYAVPKAHGYHFRTKGEALNRRNKQVNYWSYRNHWWLLRKNISRGVLVRCLPMMLGYEIAKFGYLLIAEWPTLKGFKDIWRLRKIMSRKRAVIMSTRRIKDHEMMKFFE